MATLKEEAQTYESKQIKNIADLDKVSVDIDIQDRQKTNKEGKEYTAKYFDLDGEEYRVPVPVLIQLKAQLEENEDIKYFRVKKIGANEGTTYTVVPLV